MSSSSVQKQIRAVLTGQVGVDKNPFVGAVARELQTLGVSPNIEQTGKLMYAEDPSIPKGEILSLDRGRLRALRRSIMRDVLQRAKDAPCTLLNTHACFRWHNGMFGAQDRDQLSEFAPTIFLNVVDNFHHVWARLQKHSSTAHSMMDVLVAREAEQLASATLASFVDEKPIPFYLVARGPGDRRARTVAELIAGVEKKRVYPSFPMTHVAKMPDVLARIDAFRDCLAQHFIVSDPGDVDEKQVMELARTAIEAGKEFVTATVDGVEIEFPAQELLSVENEVDRQICDRDYRLIDGGDIIVSLVPELPGGMPGLSSGVERELQHAHFTGKEVFVVWEPKRNPSPFISEQVTKLYRSQEEAITDFIKRGYIKSAA